MADLLVGITAFFAVYSVSGANAEEELTVLELVQFGFDIFSACTSMYFVTAIAFERFYAIFWPFRHRQMTSRTYLLIKGGTWLQSLSFSITTIVYTAINPNDENFQIFMGYLLLCVGYSFFAIIVLIYLSIWVKMTCCKKEVQANNATSNSKKLTITLLLMTLVSLATWAPMFAVFNTALVCPVCLASFFPRQYYGIATFLVYSNSFGNLIIYTCRMKEFRSELTKMICCKCSAWLYFCRKCRGNVSPGLNSDSVVIKKTTQPTLVRMNALPND
jgi:hypothetical protein